MIDRQVPPHRLCWTSDDRILWSGADQPRVSDRVRQQTLVQRTGQLMYELSLTLPDISGVQPEYGWHAPWSRAVERCRFIGPHRNYPHHLFALGLVHPRRRVSRQPHPGEGGSGAAEKSDEFFGFTRLAARRT